MNLIKNEKIEASRVELHFSVEQSVFEAAVERAYRKEVGKLNIPGFRKGKAPRSMIEKMYGKGFFYDTALNDILPDAYEAAIAEAAIEPVAMPEIDVLSLDENGVVFTAKVYVKPEVKIEGYFGIEVTKEVAPVTDDEINNELEQVRERYSRESDANDRPAKLGDTAVIDFEGFVDGVAFEGGKAEDYALKLGSNSFIPGFEDQIVGHSVDDEFDVNVTFPEEYHADNLSGKEAVFKIKLHALTEVELPELDDEFAKDVSEFDTFDEYKADLKAKIEERHENDALSAIDAQLEDALIEKLEADIPEVMFTNEADKYLKDLENQIKPMGIPVEIYLQYVGMTMDALKAQYRAQAEHNVKVRLAAEKIVELENIKPTEEDIEAEFTKIAQAYNIEVDQVKASIDNDIIVSELAVKLAFVAVKDHAVIKAPKKKAAKKAAPKAEAVEGEEKPVKKTRKTTKKATEETTEA